MDFSRYKLLVCASLLVGSLLGSIAQNNSELIAPNMRSSTKDAENLRVEANTYYAKGHYDKALPLLEKCLAIAQLAHGPNDPDVAEILNTIGKVHVAQHHFTQALQSQKRSLAIREKTLGPENPAVAESLINVGIVYQWQNELTNALSFIQRGLEMCERLDGHDHTNVAAVLNIMAGLHVQFGNFTAASALYQRSLSIWEHSQNKDNRQVAECLSNLGNICRIQGKLSAALTMLQDASAIIMEVGANNDPLFARILSNIAWVYIERGQFQEAMAFCQRSLAIQERALGREHSDVGDTLCTLARILEYQGKLAQAVPVLNRSLTIAERVSGPDSENAAECLSGLAEIYCKQYEFEKALPLCSRSLAIRRKTFGPHHAKFARDLEIAADIFHAMRDYPRALAALTECVAIWSLSFGNAHPLVANTLEEIGSVYLDQNDFTNALVAFERATTIREAALGKEHPDMAVSFQHLALLWHRLGRYDLSLGFRQMSIARTEKTFGPEHPRAIGDSYLMVFDYIRQGDYEKAMLVDANVLKNMRNYLADQFGATYDESTHHSPEKLFGYREESESLCADCLRRGIASAKTTGAESLALGKAFLEEFQVTRAALESDTRTSTRELLEQFQSLQMQISRVLGGKLEATERDTLRREFESQLSVLEAKLAERVGLVAQTIRERKLTSTDIAQSLQPRAALADFIQYRRLDFLDFPAKTNQLKEQRYAAYLTFPLARDYTNVVVERVDLGEAAPIDEAIEFVCKRMSAGQFAAKDLSAGLQRLSDLVYAPLAPYLTNVSHLVVCPDGQLSRLPFEMLRVGDRFLIEEKMISYVTSGREIVRLEGSPKSKVQSLESLVMGGPDFDLDLSKAGSASFQLAGSAGIPARSPADAKQDALPLEGRMPALRLLSRDYRGIRFKPLPGSEAEARSVAKLLGGDCVLRVGPEAREAELKAVVSPRVLHLATHGFFLSDQEFRRTNSLPFGWTGEWGRRVACPTNDWENPLVRCGIALAGANHAGQITNAVAEDGVLTGLEAALLNLQGTELVILSACDSGTGEVKIGEGVMSLRRAFRIAGAQTVLASHWKVSDKATSQLMTEFIRRWRSGEPRAKAWREAQLSLLHSKEFSNPYFWAAFTLTGQWR